MIRFSEEKVLLLHQLIVESTGGDESVRDRDLLDSALSNAFQTFGGKDLYPSKEEKAAALGYSLISNHAFVDGNKRIGMYIMIAFLQVNGIKIKAKNIAVEELGMRIAAGDAKYEDVLKWIRKNIIKTKRTK